MNSSPKIIIIIIIILIKSEIMYGMPSMVTHQKLSSAFNPSKLVHTH